MSEPKTAWDLTFEFGQIAVGKERWDVGIGVAFVGYGDEAEMLTNQLTAIPADATEQIKRLRNTLQRITGCQDCTYCAAIAREALE